MTKDGEILAIIMSYFSMSLVLLFLPGALFHISCQTKERLLEKNYKTVMKEFYEGLKLGSLWTRLYLLPFMMRRIIYVATGFGLKFDASLQIVVLIYLNIASLIYSIYFYPHTDNFFNYLELFNEMMTHIIMIHLLFFTDWIESKEL